MSRNEILNDMLVIGKTTLINYSAYFTLLEKIISPTRNFGSFKKVQCVVSFFVYIIYYIIFQIYTLISHVSKSKYLN